MRLIRACFLVLAILAPVSWTVAHAADEGGGMGGSDGKSKKKSGKKKSSGDSGDKGGTDK
jgi:hypothetical protein